MKARFLHVAIAAANLCAGLAVVWLVAPGIMLDMWGVDQPEAALLVARRGGALFAGLAVLLFLIRGTMDKQVAFAVAMGMATSCILLAMLGLCEFIAGHTGVGILSAVLVETVMAAAFIAVRRRAA